MGSKAGWLSVSLSLLMVQLVNDPPKQGSEPMLENTRWHTIPKGEEVRQRGGRLQESQLLSWWSPYHGGASKVPRIAQGTHQKCMLARGSSVVACCQLLASP